MKLEDYILIFIGITHAGITVVMRKQLKNKLQYINEQALTVRVRLKTMR